MRKLLSGLCFSVLLSQAFALSTSYVTEYKSPAYHVCTTSDAGKTWVDLGALSPGISVPFDNQVDAVAVGQINDCDYNGSSWTNHNADVQWLDWVLTDYMWGPFMPSPNSAVIFWQTNAPWTHATNNIGVNSVCIFGDEASADGPGVVDCFSDISI
ncbi:MAG: hypothetical protein ORN24_06750 [Burkholderiales bacterium]|nr:hypothetical protein [Burkholderiales bacterium]